jgi:outer membrane murein-binding lipoprotein Lpp
MRKKYIMIIACAVVFCLGLWWYSKAQTVSNQEMNLSDRIAKLESKLDALGMRQESAQDDIRKRLDQIINNQAMILSQIEIVKVRATRK